MSTQPPLTPAEKKKKEEEEKKKAEEKKNLDAQMKGLEGLDAVSAKGRESLKRGVMTEDAKRERTENSVAAAVLKDKVQPTVQTPERRAEAWAKANNVQFGLGGAPRFYKLVKELVAGGMSPEQAAAKAAKDMGLIR